MSLETFSQTLTRTSDALPPEGVTVLAIYADGYAMKVRRIGSRWSDHRFLGCMVFQPLYWRAME